MKPALSPIIRELILISEQRRIQAGIFFRSVSIPEESSIHWAKLFITAIKRVRFLRLLIWRIGVCFLWGRLNSGNMPVRRIFSGRPSPFGIRRHYRISAVPPGWEKAGMSETSGLVYWLHSGSATAGRYWITGMYGR